MGYGDDIVIVESARQLIALLNPQTDAAETKNLNTSLSDIAIPSPNRPITPIIIPLSDRPIDMSAAVRYVVNFDVDGFGSRSWTWVDADYGWLVWDPKATGRIDSGLLRHVPHANTALHGNDRTSIR